MQCMRAACGMHCGVHARCITVQHPKCKSQCVGDACPDPLPALPHHALVCHTPHHQVVPNPELRGVLAHGGGLLPVSLVTKAFRGMAGKTLNFVQFSRAVQQLDQWYRDKGVLGQVGWGLCWVGGAANRGSRGGHVIVGWGCNRGSRGEHVDRWVETQQGLQGKRCGCSRTPVWTSS